MPVPLDRVGVYIQPLTDKKPGGGRPKSVPTSSGARVPFVVCRLIAETGTKRLLVQSQVVLQNSCSAPLEVVLLPSSGAPSSGPEAQLQRPAVVGVDGLQLHRLTLNPGKSAGVPVDRKAIAHYYPPQSPSLCPAYTHC